MRYLKAFLALVAVGALVAIIMLLQFEHKTTINGMPLIVDGETLQFNTTLVRLKGVSAPGLGQNCLKDGSNYNCGQQARSELVKIVKKGIANCAPEGEIVDGQVSATCAIDNIDVGSEMIKTGFAVTTGTQYKKEEDQARQARLGMWGGIFEPPEEWRKTKTNTVLPKAISGSKPN